MASVHISRPPFTCYVLQRRRSGSVAPTGRLPSAEEDGVGEQSTATSLLAAVANASLGGTSMLGGGAPSCDSAADSAWDSATEGANEGASEEEHEDERPLDELASALRLVARASLRASTAPGAGAAAPPSEVANEGEVSRTSKSWAAWSRFWKVLRASF